MSTEVLVAATQAEFESDIELADKGVAGTGIEIDLAADITLTHDLDAINLQQGGPLVINGMGHTLDGGGIDRGLFAYAGTLTVENLALNDMRAQGGAGGLGGGGGGAGLGGGLFVASGATVTTDNVSFASDQAVGGQGGALGDFVGSNGLTYGAFGGGGGGLGGAGGAGVQIPRSSSDSFREGEIAGGGGGIGSSASGGSYGAAPGAGIVAGAGGAGNGTSGAGSSAGGADGGGGGGAGSYFPSGGDPNNNAFGFGGGGGVGGASGGNEQYSGGSGAGGYQPAAGNGGFGGGGSGGGSGGFGGGGGGTAGGVAGSNPGVGAGWGGGNGDAGFGVSAGGAGGFGGGGGGDLGFGPQGSGAPVNYGGGGGLGGGGGIFVQQGGKLTVGGGTIAGGSVTAGQGGSGGSAGLAFGAGIFVEGNASISLAPAAGKTLTIADPIADQNGSTPGFLENDGNNGNPADNDVGAANLILAGPGTVDLAAANTFTGGIVIQSGTLDLGAAGAAGSGAIGFAPSSSGTLDFAANLAPANTITGFGLGDTITISGLVMTGHSYDGDRLIIDGAGGPVTLTLPGLAAQAVITTSGTETTVLDGPTACFLAGTRILTSLGYMAVDALSVGDRVETIEGTTEPIIWIGRRDMSCRRHAERNKIDPVRIMANAFGPGTPTRDVFLSPDHAIYAEGVLIPIKHLINGTTVRQIEADRVSYFHIELTRHAVVLAENLPAESYCDTGDRSGFANAGVATDLHPAWGMEARDIAFLMDAKGFAPLRVIGAEVSAVRDVLARQERLRPEARRAQLGICG